MVEVDRTREVGAWQASLCERVESPTWAAVIRALLADLGRDTAASALLLEDGADPATTMLWLRRLDAAVTTAGRAPIDVSECVSWTRWQLQTLGAGRTVVYHSLVLPYLTRAEEAELEAVIEETGGRAAEAHALAWVTLEPFAAEDSDVELVVRRWPERDAHRLALLAPHGGKIRWEPQPLEGARAPTPRASARA